MTDPLAQTDYTLPVGSLEQECIRLAARVAELERTAEAALNEVTRLAAQLAAVAKECNGALLEHASAGELWTALCRIRALLSPGGGTGGGK